MKRSIIAIAVLAAIWICFSAMKSSSDLQSANAMVTTIYGPVAGIKGIEVVDIPAAITLGDGTSPTACTAVYFETNAPITQKNVQSWQKGYLPGPADEVIMRRWPELKTQVLETKLKPGYKSTFLLTDITGTRHVIVFDPLVGINASLELLPK